MKRTAYAAGMKDRRAQAIQRRKFARATGLSPTLLYGPALPRAGYSTVARSRGPLATGEMKYFDSELTGTNVPSSYTWANTVLDPDTSPVASMNCLFAPTVGAGINQRIGKSCKVFKIKIRGSIHSAPESNSTVPDGAALMRMILVMDKQTNGTQMTGTQLMRSSYVNYGYTGPAAFQNIDSFGRFRVLKDKTVVLQDPNFSWDGTNLERQGRALPFKWSVNFKGGLPVRFNNTNGGTIADIVDNSFHFLMNVSDTGLAPLVAYACRICYKE